MATEEENAKPRVARNKDEKPFDCDKCNTKGFKTIGAKQRHEREEHRPMKYGCEYCGHRTKRRYQMARHLDEAHPERHEPTTTSLSSNLGSCRSVDGQSSDDVAAGPLQLTRRSPFEPSTTAQQPFSTLSGNRSGSEVYNAWNGDNSQHSVGYHYDNPAGASLYGNNSMPLSVTQVQTSAYSVQSSNVTTSANIPYPQSDTVLWRTAHSTSQSARTSDQFNDFSTMRPPNQLDYTIPPRAPYYPGNSGGMPRNSSPYASPPNEQSSPFSQSTGSSYMGEAGQTNDWPERRPATPQ